MKNKFFFNFLLLLLLSIVGCAQNEDSIEYNEALNKLKKSDIKGAKEILLYLVENSKDPVAIHDYYYMLDSVLIIEGNKKYNELNEKDNLEKEPPNLGKYRVSLIWGSEKKNPELEPLIAEHINVLETYIRKFPYGKCKFYFLDELLFLYSKKDVEKVKKTAKLLSESPSSENKHYSYLFLGSIYHEEKDYEKAISYYDKIIALETDSVKTGAYLLYKADCYYNMDQYQKAIDLLERIVKLEQGLKKPVASIIAKEWIKIMQKAIDNPKADKEILVYFQ